MERRNGDVLPRLATHSQHDAVASHAHCGRRKERDCAHLCPATTSTHTGPLTCVPLPAVAPCTLSRRLTALLDPTRRACRSSGHRSSITRKGTFVRKMRLKYETHLVATSILRHSSRPLRVIYVCTRVAGARSRTHREDGFDERASHRRTMLQNDGRRSPSRPFLLCGHCAVGLRRAIRGVLLRS